MPGTEMKRPTRIFSPSATCGMYRSTYSSTGSKPYWRCCIEQLLAEVAVVGGEAIAGADKPAEMKAPIDVVGLDGVWQAFDVENGLVEFDAVGKDVVSRGDFAGQAAVLGYSPSGSRERVRRLIKYLHLHKPGRAHHPTEADLSDFEDALQAFGDHPERGTFFASKEAWLSAVIAAPTINFYAADATVPPEHRGISTAEACPTAAQIGRPSADGSRTGALSGGPPSSAIQPRDNQPV